MMPDHAEPHGPKEGEIGVMAGMVEPVDERRTQIRPGRVLAVASAAIRDKRQSALLRTRREYGDDHPGGLALRLGLKETPPHGRQCAEQEDSGDPDSGSFPEFEQVLFREPRNRYFFPGRRKAGITCFANRSI